MLDLQLFPIPSGGVRVSSPDGMYLDLRQNNAQIIFVGRQHDRIDWGAVATMLPGFEIDHHEVMHHHDAIVAEAAQARVLERGFISVLFKRKLHAAEVIPE